MTDTHTDEMLGATWLAADDQIIRWLRNNPGRKFEPATTPWMLDQMAARKGAYVDVGASTGWFAIPMALRGYEVIAFECNARAIIRLKENCALNDVEITLHEAAATDHVGSVTFTYKPRLPLTSGGSLERVSANRASETVPAITLDSVVDQPVALLKIDVEGHEMAVLRGAAALIEKYRPAMVLEANTGGHQAVLSGWCQQNGYGWSLADERNMLCLPAS